MNVDNFVVRPKRRLVEKYAKPEAWVALADESTERVGATRWPGCPPSSTREDEEAKRFDLLIFEPPARRAAVGAGFRRVCAIR